MVFNLNLSFGPKWENISIIRGFVNDMLSIGIVSSEEAESVAVTISELMENLVKYTSSGGAIITIHKDATLGLISIILSNASTINNVEMFKKIYNEVLDGSPKEAYKRRMINSVKQETKKSQLGLARIRFECNGTITYTTSIDFEAVKEQLGLVDEIGDQILLTIKVEIPVNLSKINKE